MQIKASRIFGYLLVVFLSLISWNSADAASGDLIWSSKAPLPTPQQGMALAVGTNNKLYSIGGSGGSSRDVFEYDSQANTWAARSSAPVTRLFSAAAAGSDGKIYVIGGLGTNAVQAYDPISDTWSNRASLPHNINNLGAVTASNGKIYAIGGICSGCSNPGQTYEYDLNTNTWTEKSPMLVSVFGFGITATSDGKIYAISGEGTAGVDSNRNIVQEYDTNTDTWSRKADLPTPRYLLGAAMLPNGRIYAVGGRTTLPDSTPIEYATVESYDPITDTWRSENPMSSVRGSLGVATLSGLLYAVGGFDCHFTSQCSDLDVVESAYIERQLTSLNPAKVWIGLKNVDDTGIRFDIKAEVYKDGVLVSSGQVDSVDGGGTSFANALPHSIPFDSFAPVDFPVGSNLSMKVSVRNACTGSAVTSGKARLWFDSSSADSQFGTVFDTVSSDYFLSSAFALLTSPGPGPKQHIDIGAGSQCSSFKTFGTWSITL